MEIKPLRDGPESRDPETGCLGREGDIIFREGIFYGFLY
jgi:hypothetical protein